jgi:hypothetical protein
MHGFWQITLGQVVSTLGVLVSVVLFLWGWGKTPTSLCVSFM